VLLGLGAPGHAAAPKGGDVLVFDRGSQLGGTSSAVFGLHLDQDVLELVSYVTSMRAPQGVGWGPGKTIYVGDGARLWAVDGYADPSDPPREITSRYLFAVADVVHARDGRIFVLDQFADPLEEGFSGAVLELDPATETIGLIASDPRFVAPFSLVAEPAGTLLVLDPYGRMTLGGPPVGAVYRVDPATHAVQALFSLQFLAPGTRPVAIALRDANTLLLADADATFPGYRPLGGAIYLVSLTSHEPIGVLREQQFRDPIDLIVTSDRRLVVLDVGAAPLSDPRARGALFVFDLSDNQLLTTIARTYFRQLNALDYFDSPDLDGSLMSLSDVNGGALHPGERLRLELALTGRGPRESGPVTLTAETGGLICLFGSAAADHGTFAFDDATSRLHWEGNVTVGDTAHLAVDLRVPETATQHSAFSVPVRIENEMIRLERVLADTVGFTPSPGMTVYVDAGTGFPAPRLFTLDSDTWTPLDLYHSSTLLPYPTDAVFGLDGTLYVLNSNPGRVLALDLETSVATTLYQGAPLTRPSGICLARDGSLLIADPGLTTPVNTPGVVFRFDPTTGAMTTFYSETNPDLLRDPVDICPDRDGHFLVTDYQSKAAGGEYGALFEIDQDGERVGAPYATGAIMTDPFSAVVTPSGAAYITDIARGAASVIRLTRPAGQAPTYERLAGPSDTMLVRPLGIDRIAQNRFMICDGASNPLGGEVNPLGTLTRLEGTSQGTWQLTFETYHSDLRTPRRSATFTLPEPACAGIQLRDANGGRLVPGDTLEARAALVNRSPAPAVGVGAVLSYGAVLHPVSASSPEGQTMIDEAYGQVHWTGDLAFLETDTLTVRFWIDPLAVQGQVAELEVAMIGGLESEPAAARDTVSAPLRGGEWIVLDQEASGFDYRSRGGFFTIDLEQGTLVPYRSSPALVRPSDVCMAGATRILVVDSEANPYGYAGPTGAVFFIVPQTGGVGVFSASPRYKQPQRILADPNGGWLLLDPRVDECGAPARGAIFRLPPGGGTPELLACDSRFRRLTDMAVDGQGHVWVADPDANPFGFGTAVGALFAIDLQTGAVVQVVSVEEMHDPTGLLWVEGLGLLFTDPAYRDPFGNCVIRSFDPASEAIRAVLSSPYLSTPTRMAVAGDRLWIADSTATPPGSTLSGAIVEAVISDQLLLRYIQSPAARRLQALAQVPLPAPSIARFAADEDVAGRWHAKGDTLHCGILLVNASDTPEPSAALDVRLSSNVVLNPASITVTAGQALSDAAGLVWQGALAAWDSVTIRYAATLALPPGTSPYTEQRAVLSVPFGAGDSSSLGHYISNVTGDRELVVVDTWANPRQLPNAAGALFRIEGPIRDAVPILADSLFTSPVAAQLVPGSQTDFLIVDADTRLPGSSVGGCLFRGSTTTGEVRPLFVHSSFIEPRSVAAVDAHVAYLLDQRADPYNLRPGGGDDGPGAIFRVDLDTGLGEVIVSDTLFINPVDLLWDATSGDLFVIDREATSGGGGFRGGVWRVNPTTRVVTPLQVGAPFRSPRAGALGPDGSVLVIDFHELAGSMTYAVTPGVGAIIYCRCDDAETPRDLLYEPEGSVLIADATFSPEGVEEPAGSIMRNSRSGSLCRVHRTGAPLVRPGGLVVYYAPTPVDQLDVLLTQIPAGVEVSWTVPAEDGACDYYVYRRALSDGAESPYALLNPRRPVRGPGPVTYLDGGVETNGDYEYLVVAVLGDGSRREYGPFEIRVEFAAARFFLAPPAPNPLTLRHGAADMVVRFGVPRRGAPVRLLLLDVTGRCVRELWNARAQEAVQSIAWDGRDASGNLLASGIYFLRLEADSRVANRRVILVR